jgi:phosphatidylglycerol:prolipoprotein diacylglycerol transferase
MYRVLFQCGPVTVFTYGVFIAIAFITATALAMSVSEKYGVERSKLFDCLIAALAGGLIGGRLLFAIIHISYFREYPYHIFMLNQGGLAVQGAIAGGTAACLLTAWFRKAGMLKVLDVIAPYAALGQAIGRIGCYFNGCCYGRPVKGLFGVVFPGHGGLARIPLQLYSSVGLLIMFLILGKLRDKKMFPGSVFSVYLMVYSFFRFFMDFLRGDELYGWGDLTLSQYISVLFFIGGLLFFFTAKRVQLRR